MQYIHPVCPCGRQAQTAATPSLKNTTFIHSRIVKDQPILNFTKKPERNEGAAFALLCPLPRLLARRPPAPAVRQHLVEPTGIEPVTSCLQSRRSPS